MKDVCTYIAENNARQDRSVLTERPVWDSREPSSMLHVVTPMSPLEQPVDEWEDRTEHDRAVASYLRTIGLE